MFDSDLKIEQSIDNLPRLAQVAFAARCARWIQPLFNEHHNDLTVQQSIDNWITAIEQYAEGENKGVKKNYLIDGLVTDQIFKNPIWVTIRSSNDELSQIISNAIATAWSVDSAFSDPTDYDYYLNKKYLKDTIEYTVNLIKKYPDAEISLYEEYNLLFEYATKHAKNITNIDLYPCPSSFFTSRIDFTNVLDKNRDVLIEVSDEFNHKFAESVRKNPELMYTLYSREFEMFIADLFDKMGFDVELTAETRDGGKDIIAVRYMPFKFRCLIECKRYGKDKPVGLDIVQRLYGVTQFESANKGLLVTTGRITAPAKEFMESDQVKWLLEGKEYNDIIQWLVNYDRQKRESFMI
jgi:HJR/Mrr/RecB family endonuclease